MTWHNVSFFFSSRRRHTRCSRDWSSDVCSSDLENQSVLFGLRTEDLEDQLLLPHAARPGNVQILGDLGEVGDVLFFQLGKADAHLIASFNVCFFWHISLALIVKIDPGNPDCF